MITFLALIVALAIASGAAVRANAAGFDPDSEPWRHPNWSAHEHGISFAQAYDLFEGRPLVREKLTVGFEIEGHVVRDGATARDREPARVRARFLKQIMPLVRSVFATDGDPLRRDRLEVLRGDRLFMAVTSDESIDPPDGRVDVEINSPVLELADYHVKVRRFFRELEILDFQFTPRCAIHAHVGYPEGELSAGELILLNDVFSALQRQLFRVFQPRPQRARYIRPIRSFYDYPHNALRVSVLHDLPIRTSVYLAGQLGLSNHRDFLDIQQSLRQHRTIELRLANASYDRGPIELEYAVELLAGLIWAIRTRDPGLRRFLSARESAEIHLHEVNRILGLSPPDPTQSMDLVGSCQGRLL